MRGILWFFIVGFSTGLLTYRVFSPGTGFPDLAKVISGIFRVGFFSFLAAGAIGLLLDFSKIEQALGVYGAIVGAVAGGAIWAGVHWFRARASRTLAAQKRIEWNEQFEAGQEELERAKTEALLKRARIFISYRREGDAALAGRIADRLGNEFGPDHIFMDVDAMRLGFDFVEIINEEVAKCDVLLAVIGPRWLELLDTNQTSPVDFVRLEIAAALKRKIPVIPILVDGTKIPPADRLPEELQDLERRHALDLRNQSFRADMDRLVWELKTSKGS
jgi:hypothetical protein